PLEVCLAAPLDGKRAARYVVEERLPGARAQMLAREVVDLGKNRPRQNPFLPGRVEELGDRGAIAVAPVEQGYDGAGIGDDHFRPKPFKRFSARRATSRRTLAPAPMLVGRGRGHAARRIPRRPREPET